MKPIRITSLALAAVLGAVSGGCAASDSGGPGGVRDQTLTIAAALDINSYDPADGVDGHFPQYLQPVYDSLLRIESDGSAGPMLATEFRYTDDARTVLELTLREGVTFSDGVLFDAEAVKANLLNVKAGNGTLSTALASVANIQVLSPARVQIKLSAPDPILLRNLGQPPGMMASPKALGTRELKTAPVGSGPYTLDTTATVPGSQYTYVRNDNHWNAKAHPYAKIVFKPMDDATARLNAVLSGQVDVAMGDPKNAEAARAGGLTITRWSTGDLGAVFIFDRGGKLVPALREVKVRQAINYALDADAMVKQLIKGYGRPTRQVFNLDSVGYDPQLEKRYTYNPAMARQLLAEAGYPNGFTLPMPELPFLPEMNAIVAQQLADVGIRVEWQKVSPSSALAEMSAGKYSVGFGYLQSGDPWQALQYYVAPNAPWNPLRTRDLKVDELIAKAQVSTGDAQAAIYRELNAYLVEQAWYAPWSSPDQIWLSNKRVKVTPQAFAPVPPVWNYAPAEQ